MAADDRVVIVEGGKAIHDASLAEIESAPPTDFTRALKRLHRVLDL